MSDPFLNSLRPQNPLRQQAHSDSKLLLISQVASGDERDALLNLGFNRLRRIRLKLRLDPAITNRHIWHGPVHGFEPDRQNPSYSFAVWTANYKNMFTLI